MHKLALVSLTGLLLCSSCSESWTVEGKSDREIVEHYAHEFAEQMTESHKYYRGLVKDCLPKWGICTEKTYTVPTFKFKVLSVSEEPMDMYYKDSELRRVEGGKFEYFPVYYDGIKAYKVNYAVYGKEEERGSILKTLLDRTMADFEWNTTTGELQFEWTGKYFEGLYEGFKVNEEKTLDLCYLAEYRHVEGRLDKIYECDYATVWLNYKSGVLW